MQPLPPKVKEFMLYILSRQGQEDVAKVGDYFPLTPTALVQERKKIE